MPFISFIIATYNCKSQVQIFKETVKSLQLLDVEFLVADGGSMDGTVEELSLIKGIDIVVSAPDNGIYDAWNRALSFAKGRYISFIGIDDVPQEKFIVECSSLLSSMKDPIGIIYGDAIIQFNLKSRLVRTPEKPRLFYGSSPVFDIAHQGMLHSALLFRDGGFNDCFKLAGDFHFLLKMREQILSMGIKKVNCIQSIINSDGISMSPRGHLVYLKEYSYIENELSLKVGYSKFRLVLISLFSNYPKSYHFLRRLSWKMRDCY